MNSAMKDIALRFLLRNAIVWLGLYGRSWARCASDGRILRRLGSADIRGLPMSLDVARGCRTHPRKLRSRDSGPDIHVLPIARNPVDLKRRAAAPSKPMDLCYSAPGRYLLTCGGKAEGDVNPGSRAGKVGGFFRVGYLPAASFKF